MKYNIYFGIILSLLVGGAAGYYLSDAATINAAPAAEMRIIRDTVVEVRRPDPIVLEKVKTRIIEKRDTLLLTRPFIAVVDTVFRTDTIFASFEFPENQMSFRVNSPPDSLAYLRESIIKTTRQSRPWWEAPAMVSGGALLGAIITLMVK
jgi:hypothetical protein